MSNTKQKQNPDFIKDNKRPEGFNRIAPAGINKASFNGDTYSWSSNNSGWFKDTPVNDKQEQTETVELIVREDERRGIFEININSFNLNGTDLAEMTTNHPVEYQKQMANELANRYNQYPTLYRDNAQLKEQVKLLRDSLAGLLSSYKCDFKIITGGELNQTESVKAATEALNQSK